VSSPAQLQKLGGLTADKISSGDWATLTAPLVLNYPRRWGGYDPSVTVQCDYNYRDVVSLLAWTSWASSPAPGTPPPTDFGVGGVLLGWTKPGVKVQAGLPSFRTQRTLGGRAIVSDSFSDSFLWSVIAAEGFPKYPGMGYYAHRDGYNVLYGDWSAKWYGDAQRQIMWFSPTEGPTYGCDVYYMSLCYNDVLEWSKLDGTYPWDSSNPEGFSTNDFTRSGPKIWHLFDVNHGIDVDAQH
jgi:hypothetical protein